MGRAEKTINPPTNSKENDSGKTTNLVVGSGIGVSGVIKSRTNETLAGEKPPMENETRNWSVDLEAMMHQEVSNKGVG